MLEIYLWHPIFVHFSVALLSLATVFYVLATLFRANRWQPQWIVVALWNLWVGVAITVFTVVLGWLAFNTVHHDDESHMAMTIHRNWALATASGFALLALWSIFRRKTVQVASRVFAGLLVVFAAMLTITGLRGGELVYRYGLAVSALPQSDKEEAAAVLPKSNAAEPTQPDPTKPAGAVLEPHEHHHHHHHDAAEHQ